MKNTIDLFGSKENHCDEPTSGARRETDRPAVLMGAAVRSVKVVRRVRHGQDSPTEPKPDDKLGKCTLYKWRRERERETTTTPIR
jgi:hypothetical protein